MASMQIELRQLKIIDMDAGEVFSNRPSGAIVKGSSKPCACTHAIDPDCIFQDARCDTIVRLHNSGGPLYIFGPCGSGKTSHIKQLAARLNYPVFEVTAHGHPVCADLAGHLTVQDGNMTYQYRPLALAIMYGGICLVNEIDLTSPEAAAGLNAVLDGSPLCIAENGGELIKPHPMFRFVATANTNGGGDETGLLPWNIETESGLCKPLHALRAILSSKRCGRKAAGAEISESAADFMRKYGPLCQYSKKALHG